MKTPSTRKTCGDLGKKNWAYRHGKFGSRIHKIWDGMIQRCHNPNCKDYKNWGARGIKVCKRWRDFINFYADMGDVPENGLKMSLGRIDNNKGYFKKNCEWQTWKQQHRNKRNSKILTFNGKTQNLSAWIEEVAINHGTFTNRKYLQGWSYKDALFTPVDKRYSRKKGKIQ